MNEEIAVEPVGDGFVRKTASCYVAKNEMVRWSSRSSDELIVKKLAEAAGLEPHYNKPFVSIQVEYNPDDEVYRISLTWFEFENTSKVQPAPNLNENNHNISEEMEPPC